MPSRRAIADLLKLRKKLPHGIGVMDNRRRPPMPLPAAPCLRNASFHTLAENLAFKVCKNRQHPGQRSSWESGNISPLQGTTASETHFALSAP